MLSIRFENITKKCERYEYKPEKYTKKGSIRVAWKHDTKSLLARARSIINQYDQALANGRDDWFPPFVDLVDAYGYSWRLYLENQRGFLKGVLVEEG